MHRQQCVTEMLKDRRKSLSKWQERRECRKRKASDRSDNTIRNITCILELYDRQQIRTKQGRGGESLAVSKWREVEIRLISLRFDLLMHAHRCYILRIKGVRKKEMIYMQVYVVFVNFHALRITRKIVKKVFIV